MAQAKKDGYRKRTLRLSDAMMERLREIAEREGRTVTAQLERFIWAQIKEYDKKESSSGPRLPARLDAASA